MSPVLALHRSPLSGDPTDQAGAILALPDHLRDALARVDAAGPLGLAGARALVIAGMGGSAIGAQLAEGLAGAASRIPVTCVREYDAPAWIGPDTAVLCSSYSGQTEETLAFYDAVRRAGARIVVTTTGGALGTRARVAGHPAIELPAGLQPRAAVGYALVAAMACLADVGAIGPIASDVLAAAEHLDERVARWSPQTGTDALPERLAQALLGTVPVITGVGAMAAVAYRWKCQLNENSKVPAFSGALPEGNHNELVGWAHAPGLAPLSAVLLDDPAAHPRARARVPLTAELVAQGAAGVHVLASDAPSPLARMLELVLLGDLTSLQLAFLRGVDPAEIDVLTGLKRRLTAVGAATDAAGAAA
jgi:glucose/mannose-6-phosphate isomerase